MGPSIFWVWAEIARNSSWDVERRMLRCSGLYFFVLAVCDRDQTRHSNLRVRSVDHTALSSRDSESEVSLDDSAEHSEPLSDALAKALRGKDAPLQVDGMKKDFLMMHISDSHILLRDEHPPLTTRMFDAFKCSSSMCPSSAFEKLMKVACEKRVDLIALGGDIVSFPSQESVSFVREQLRQCGLPFVYVAGNHDWLREGVPTESYDSMRGPELFSTLKPLLDPADLEHGGLYGSRQIKGVDVYYFDNSNFQINEEQLAFAQKKLGDSSKRAPAVVLLHIPLMFPGVDLPPQEVCGHPEWGSARDVNGGVENRTSWPKENLPSTLSFLRFVQAQSAPSGRIVAVLAGHTHLQAATSFSDKALSDDHLNRELLMMDGDISDDDGAAETWQTVRRAAQYVTDPAASGNYQLLKIRGLNYGANEM
eukprot:TRINITY_DN34166_c0_g1_i1.p1 TRINITY_DN34166_c0_g1~~TRINITY_DN34166_c0_g1_i1.p1  ORF type:complete len:422 (+),score=63.95 TRINITY_DN34166_c0_g1_i1:2-1267(+)